MSDLGALLNAAIVLLGDAVLSMVFIAVLLCGAACFSWLARKLGL